MKKLTSSFIILLLILSSTFVVGQDNSETASSFELSTAQILEETKNFGFGVTTEQSLRGALLVYDDLIKKGVKVENYEIVVWGKILKDIKEDKALFEFIENNMNKNIRLSVCAIAMNKLKLTLADLPKGIQLTENAFIRIFELQAMGYNFVIP